MAGLARLVLVLLAAPSVALLALAPGAGAEAVTKRLGYAQVAELDLNLTAGQRAAWNISIDIATPEIYNIHAHEPGNLSNVTYFDGGLFNRTVGGTFTAPHDGLYSWFVENGVGHDAFTATITVEPLAAPARTPFPALPLAGLAALGAARLRRR